MSTGPNLYDRAKAFVEKNPFALVNSESLAYAIGAHPKNCYRALRDMHAEGLVWIACWIRSTGSPVPVYQSNKIRKGVDAERPRPIPATARTRSRRTDKEAREHDAGVKRFNRQTMKQMQAPAKIGVWNL